AGRGQAGRVRRRGARAGRGDGLGHPGGQDPASLLIKPEVGSSGPVDKLFELWAQERVTLAAPRLMWEEVLNALLTGIRRQRWSGEQADVAASLLERLPVTSVTDERDRDRAFELARRYDNWPVYDMVYVAVAERLSDTLVTVDERL